MKKHFLLLLMAFMSISTWAIDLDVLWAPTTYYGTVPAYLKVYTSSGVEVTEANYDFDGYFTDAACSVSATAAEVRAANAGTTFYVKVTGINGFEGSPTTSFTIAAMPLTVTVADASKKYLANDPASFTIDAIKDVNGTDVKTALAASMTVVRETGDVVKYNTEGAIVGYSYTATSTNPNYTVTATNGTFTIEPRAFKDILAEGTIKVEVSGFPTYSGSAQLPTTITVTDKKDAETTLTLVKDKDFTVTGSDNIAASTTLPTVIVTGKGNYAASTVEATFTINPAPLLVTPNPTKVYDAAATLPDPYAGAFSYQGFVDDKTAENVTVNTAYITWALADGVTESANVGEYAVKITSTEGFTLTNYRFVAQPGIFEITPSEALKLKAKSYTGANAIEYGTAVNFELDETKGIVGYLTTDDRAALLNAIEIVKSEAPGEDTYYDLTPGFMTADKINASSTLTAEQKTAAIAAAKNYKLLTANITVGKLQYKNAALMIALKESAYDGLTKVYDGQPVSVTLNKESGLIISPATATVDLSELKLTVVEKVEGAGTANVATYRLELSGAKATNYDITYVPSQYKVTKRNLPITVGEQTFIKGEALNLDQTLYTFGTGENAGLASTDKATEVFKLTTTIVAEGTPAVITSEAGNYAINVVDCGAEGSKWANYNVIVAAGNATAAHVVAATSLLDTSAEDGITTVAEANANVTISSDRVLNPENWNAMVLPFEVSVAQLSETFGYAIVNRLNTSATTADHVAFSVEMKSIPANEPFLVKVVGNKTGSEYKAFSLNGVTFKGVNLVVAASTPIEAAGNKFTGVYKAQELLGPTYGFLYDDPTGARENKWYTPRNNAYTIQPLDAFLTYATAKAPVITVEDIDGTVTAIQAVNAGEFRQVESEGWYTLGGMKLQGAPTQKGVYINNGKKVVIK